MALTGQQIRDLGYNPDTVSSMDGGMYDLSQFLGGTGLQGNYDFLNQQTDNYINDLLSSVNGDKDFAIRQITQAHDTAVGSNDQETAKFLEQVASDLEKKVGRIPYDYQVGVERANLSATTALDRLAEDEKVWKAEKLVSDKEATTNQQEGLLQRGILSGTRENATGLAGAETKKLDTELSNQLSAYDRALNRATTDVNTQQAQTLEDLRTGARRGVEDVQTQTSFQKEAAQRAADAKKKELERQRQLQREANKAYAPQLTYGLLGQ